MASKDIRVGLYGDYVFYVGYLSKKPFYISKDSFPYPLVDSTLSLEQAIAGEGNHNYTWRNNVHELFLKWLKDNINNIPEEVQS